MSDVALITGSATVIGTGIGGLIAYLTSKNGNKTAIHNANRHAEVELEKVRAESKRQLDQYREEERRNRQGTYHQLLAAFTRLDWWARNPRGLGKHYQPIVSEIQFLEAGCSMFGDEAVNEALSPIMDLLADIDEPGQPSDEGQDHRRHGYNARRDELIEAQRKLASAMRADVTSIHG